MPIYRINEILFGVTSNDALFSLSSDETSKISENRLARLSNHILQQQSYQPQFPIPSVLVNNSIGGVPVALVTLYGLAQRGHFTWVGYVV